MGQANTQIKQLDMVLVIGERDNDLKFIIQQGKRDHVCIFDTGSDGNNWPSWSYSGPVKKERPVRVYIGTTEKITYRGWHTVAERLHVLGVGDLTNVPLVVTEVKNPFKPEREVYTTDMYPLISAFFLVGRCFRFDFTRRDIVRLQDVPSFKPQFRAECIKLVRLNQVCGMFVWLPFTLDGKPGRLLFDTGLASEHLVLNRSRFRPASKRRVRACLTGTRLSRDYDCVYSEVMPPDMDGLVGWQFFKGTKLLIDSVRNVGSIK